MSEVTYGYYITKDLEKLREMLPNHTGLLVALGTIYSNRYEFDKATELLEKAISIDPQEAEAHKQLGELFRRNRNPAKAIFHHRKALQTLTYTEAELISTAWIFQEEDDYQGAVELYDKVLEQNPEQLSALINAGYCYGHLENNEKALEYATRALQIRPNQTTALLNLGFRYWVSHRLEEARQYTERCLQLAYNYDLAHMNLGHIYLCEGQEEEALKSYTNSVENTSDWDNFEKLFLDDWKYMKTYNISEETYQQYLEHCRNQWKKRGK